MTTVTKRALHEVHHSGGVAAPGSTFECPVEDVEFLASVGAIEDPDGGTPDAGADQTAGDPPDDDADPDPEDDEDE